MKSLSIITINLNNSIGLQKTIESVIDQKDDLFEYLIIDGGSVDQSISVINKYENSIDYWISEPDKGIYNAMNKGIIKSCGQYCLFLNSGDVLIKEALNKIKNIDLTEDIIYGNILLTYKNGSQIKDTGAGHSNLTFYNFFAGSSIRHQAAFIKTDLFKSYGFYDESYKIVSDWVFFMNVIIFKQVSVKYININIAYFDPYGVGSTDSKQVKIESELELKKKLPKGILDDYQEMKSLKDQNEILKNELGRYTYRFKFFDGIISKIKYLFIL